MLQEYFIKIDPLLHQHDSHNSIEDKMGGVVKRGMQW
jgi:hypothetical protein